MVRPKVRFYEYLAHISVGERIEHILRSSDVNRLRNRADRKAIELAREKSNHQVDVCIFQWKRNQWIHIHTVSHLMSKLVLEN